MPEYSRGARSDRGSDTARRRALTGEKADTGLPRRALGRGGPQDPEIADAGG